MIKQTLYFTRSPDGAPPNNLLNYGYAVLRAAMARALVGTGLLPTLGIFPRNQYNAYCLADDVMEPQKRKIFHNNLNFFRKYVIFNIDETDSQ